MPLYEELLNKYSRANEKILLYLSLFCGREDVFARRWYSKTTKKADISLYAKVRLSLTKKKK